MRGRKPTPTALKILRGNPGKRPLNDREPQPRAGIPPCPKELTDDAAKEWTRITEILNNTGTLTHADLAIVTAYCLAWARLLEAERECRIHGSIIINPTTQWPTKSPWAAQAETATEAIRKLSAELGLSPTARCRIKTPGPAPAAADLDSFLRAN